MAKGCHFHNWVNTLASILGACLTLPWLATLEDTSYPVMRESYREGHMWEAECYQ